MLGCALLFTTPNLSFAEKQTFGDWQVICEDDVCRMVQSVIEASTERDIVVAKAFAGNDPTLLLTFPLGILLKTGWRYQIDAGAEHLLPFEICNIEGCHAVIKLESKTLNSLRLGTELNLSFQDARNRTVSPKISLSGFTKSYEALVK